MPIYEYRCENCSDTFEVLQTLHDDVSAVCPNCGRHSKERVHSTPAVLIPSDGNPCGQSSCQMNGGGCPRAGSCGMAHDF